MPRVHRYNAGLGVQEMALRLVDLLIVAEYTRERADLLRQANLLLEQMRFRVRMCRDLSLLTILQYEHASREIDSVGSSIGSWAKSSRARPLEDVGEE